MLKMAAMAVLMPKVSILSPPLALTGLHRRQASISFPFLLARRAVSFSTTGRASDANTTIPAPQEQQLIEEGEVKEEDALREAGNSLDLRVGRITIAYRHPEADSLYVEEVDVGEAEPRIVCSGLVDYIPINDLQGLSVVVLANLKPRNMRGVRSYGMLMAASDAEHRNVELLLPPPDSLPGQRIWFGGESGDDGDKPSLPPPASPNQVQKKKIWESVQPHLKTDDSGIASLGPHTMRTHGGAVVAKTLKNARIS